MQSKQLAVIAGTTVPEGVGGCNFGPFRIPFFGVAGFIYKQFADLSGSSRVFGLHRLGLAHSEESYQRLKPRILRFAKGRMIDIIGDSQGGYPAIRFASEFPEKVGHLVLLSVPLDGTQAAYVIDTAGTRCMRPGSDYVEQIQQDLEYLLDHPNGPRVTCISSGHDYLVPHHSAGFHHPDVRNICISHSGHATLHDMWELAEVWDGRFRNHITEVFLRHTGRTVAKVLAEPSRPHLQVVPDAQVA